MRIWDIFRTRSRNEDEKELKDPLERSCFKKLKKYLSPDAIIHPHYVIDAKDEISPVNFLIEASNKRIVIEFQSEDSNDEKDRDWKDSQIIGTNQIDTIYRFIGNDISPFLDDCIYFISQFDGDIFNPNYPHLQCVLKYEEKKRNIIYYNMVGEDGQFAYRLQLIMDLINRKTCQHLFEFNDTL